MVGLFGRFTFSGELKTHNIIFEDDKRTTNDFFHNRRNPDGIAICLSHRSDDLPFHNDGGVGGIFYRRKTIYTKCLIMCSQNQKTSTLNDIVYS